MPSHYLMESKEYRICGANLRNEPWTGPWREGEPTATILYDAKHLAARNSKVYIETRDVKYSNYEMEEIHAAE